MLAKVIIENGVKKIQALTADTGTGAPVGSYLYLEKKSNPQGYLYCDGSTFDETVYPALYQYLGTNVLPDWRELGAKGAEKNTTLIFDSTETNPSTGQAGTQNHDVFTQGEFKDDQLQEHKHLVNSSSSAGVNGIGVEGANKTGAFLTDNAQNARVGNVTRGKSRAVFIYIKATSGLTENQQENVLNTINENNSYSTEEHPTGKKWIDGKPIYSITVVQTAFGSSVNAVPLNVNKITKLEGLLNSHGGIIYSNPYYQTSSDYWNFYVTGRDVNSRGQGVVPVTISITLEYTKTTD